MRPYTTIIFLLPAVLSKQLYEHVNDIKNKILPNYDPDVIPIHDYNKVNVTITVTLTQLVELNEYSQYQITSQWLKMQWSDYRLQ